MADQPEVIAEELPAEAEQPAQTTTPRPKRSRFAPLILLAGGIAAAVVFAPHIPRERRVELRLQNPPTVTRVDVAWAAKSQGDEPVKGGSWRFTPGTAPSTLTAPVSLPDG